TGPHRRIARHARTLSAMRIVSLVPAATEIACALGATGELVAVTHDDDFPPEVLSLPRVTRSTIPPHATAREIDTLVREAGGRGGREGRCGNGTAARRVPRVAGSALQWRALGAGAGRDRGRSRRPWACGRAFARSHARPGRGRTTRDRRRDAMRLGRATRRQR